MPGQAVSSWLSSRTARGKTDAIALSHCRHLRDRVAIFWRHARYVPRVKTQRHFPRWPVTMLLNEQANIVNLIPHLFIVGFLAVNKHNHIGVLLNTAAFA